jgi:hypothetical protein
MVKSAADLLSESGVKEPWTDPVHGRRVPKNEPATAGALGKLDWLGCKGNFTHLLHNCAGVEGTRC